MNQFSWHIVRLIIFLIMIVLELIVLAGLLISLKQQKENMKRFKMMEEKK